MAKSPRENRVPIMLSDDELGAIDDWRYRNRVATRSEAVRRLVQMGLLIDSTRSEFLDLLKAEATVEQTFADAFSEWVKDKGLPPLRISGSPAEERFADAYAAMLGEGAVRVEFVSSLARRIAEISKAESELEMVISATTSAREFYSSRSEEIRRQRKGEGK